jgi:hypothetical protein
VVTHFDYLFADLQADSANLLDESPETPPKLKRLGETMLDPGYYEDTGQGIPDSGIPSVYTYFGQFVDHDITREDESSRIVNIAKPDIKPIPPGDIRRLLFDKRSPNLDLDSVYGVGSIRDHDWMRVGRVSYSKNGRPEGKGDYNDLPRSERSSEKGEPDRVAQVGDSRNDENLIIAQIHVAFLHAHNNLINQGYKFQESSKTIRQHYQYVVLEDFLNLVADPGIVDSSLKKNRFFNPPKNGFFMPLEFSAAAFRFGHSMVRAAYNDFNDRNISVGLEMLFAFTRSSGDLGSIDNNSDTLPEDWIIRWEHFVDTGKEFNHARRIDTALVKPLLNLPPDPSAARPTEPSLAVRNLLRGYILRLPTGQAVARRMGLTPLSRDQLASVAEEVSAEQLKVLEDTGFISNTPLWYYILAEAASGGNDHLGPVGSIIVAEVLLEILRLSDDSILSYPYTPDNPWVPSLTGATAGKFDLSDFLRFAGVLG